MRLGGGVLEVVRVTERKRSEMVATAEAIR